MIYRDGREKCPRCGVELVYQRAGASCGSCAGLWISVEGLQEMTSNMQSPPEPAELPWEGDARQALPCPRCTEPMDTRTLHGVPIDICAKRHGVWFDAHELGSVLLRSAKHLM